MQPDKNKNTSLQILQEILQIYRGHTKSIFFIEGDENIEAIKSIQLPRIDFFVNAEKPIEFILPAFPSKSPNKNKVLGELPDMAERISLSFLNKLCHRIGNFYKPGAKLTICSDGHVFGDLIRTTDEVINNYQKALQKIVYKQYENRLSIFNLHNFEPFSKRTRNYEQMRQLLVAEYAQPLDEIKQVLLREQGGISLYRAITRFMFEDGLTPDFRGSRSWLQKDSKVRALGVIQRSWAWGTLLSSQFPNAIRLSIHPQPVSSLKIGIHLMPTQDSWLTPWHGVAVDNGDRYILMKRRDVIHLGGKIVMHDQQPSHYEIKPSQHVNESLLPLFHFGSKETRMIENQWQNKQEVP